MPLEIDMQFVPTGEVRTIVTDGEWYGPNGPNEGGGDEFIWTDGNYACDCNRAVFFAEAKQEPPPENVSCVGKNYRIVAVRNSSGVIGYAE